MSRRNRTWAVGALAVLVAAGVVLGALTRQTDTNANPILTAHKARDLVLACRAYRQHPGSGGRYPATLADLLAPPFGGGPLLVEGEDPSNVLTDPWGNPFKYALVPNADGEPEPYVWAERTKDGATTLIGAKLTAEGEVVAFGLPPDP